MEEKLVPPFSTTNDDQAFGKERSPAINPIRVPLFQQIALSAFSNFPHTYYHHELGKYYYGAITRTKGDAPPAHYIMRIESFSQLTELVRKTGVEKYESRDFESGGYKWKLLLYPCGNTKRNGNDHISLYLAIADTSFIPLVSEVNVIIKFFVFDQIQDKYLTIQDGKVRRFHALKSEQGFDRLLPLETFNDSSSGYLVDDCCTFGVEAHVIKYTGNGEKLSILKEPGSGTYTWKLENFSTLKLKKYYSEVFTVDQSKWKLLLYPKGLSKTMGKNLSFFLQPEIRDMQSKARTFAEFKLSIKDQVCGRHHERTAEHLFDERGMGWGYGDFITLTDLNNATKGYLVNDTLIVKAKITLISVVEDFPLKRQKT